MKYWIERWSQLRKKELMPYPNEFPVHDVYKTICSHEELIKRNYFYDFQDWNEGPQIRYYKKEGDRNRNTNADFWLTSMYTEFRFYFRIKTMDKVLEYIKSCPENVISNFMSGDNGCANRISGACVSGISYQLNDKTVWRCGCCSPNFQITPSSDDYLYYINAVEMAGKK